MSKLTLADLKLYIDNLYDQLDHDTIDQYTVDGLIVTDDNGNEHELTVSKILETNN